MLQQHIRRMGPWDHSVPRHACTASSAFTRLARAVPTAATLGLYVARGTCWHHNRDTLLGGMPVQTTHAWRPRLLTPAH